MRKPRELPLLALLADGGVNDLPVVVPAATPMSATLIAALKTVRAAGFRAVRPRKPKVFKRGKDRVGPTCVVRFSDGVTVRMSVCTPLEKLDWERGMKLARAAWESRWRRQRARQMGKPRTVNLAAPVPPLIIAPIPPLILSAYFEERPSGKVLARYAPNQKSIRTARRNELRDQTPVFRAARKNRERLPAR
jgi:hypothetical protein